MLLQIRSVIRILNIKNRYHDVTDNAKRKYLCGLIYDSAVMVSAEVDFCNNAKVGILLELVLLLRTS
jgi:hypothetical protein